jgi:hypothetical protein
MAEIRCHQEKIEVTIEGEVSFLVWEGFHDFDPRQSAFKSNMSRKCEFPVSMEEISNMHFHPFVEGLRLLQRNNQIFMELTRIPRKSFSWVDNPHSQNQLRGWTVVSNIGTELKNEGRSDWAWNNLNSSQISDRTLWRSCWKRLIILGCWWESNLLIALTQNTSMLNIFFSWQSAWAFHSKCKHDDRSSPHQNIVGATSSDPLGLSRDSRWDWYPWSGCESTISQSLKCHNQNLIRLFLQFLQFLKIFLITGANTMTALRLKYWGDSHRLSPQSRLRILPSSHSNPQNVLL